MSRIVKIEISETVEELKGLLKLAENQEVKERVQTLYWLKSGQIKTVSEIANLIGKHRTSVSRWLSSYRTGGIRTLLSKGKSSGRQRKLSPSVEESLKQELQDAEGFSSYKEVQRWLKVLHDLDVSYTGVHKIVRYRLKAKLKVPRPTHTKQKPEAVEEFKKAHRPR